MVPLGERDWAGRLMAEIASGCTPERNGLGPRVEGFRGLGFKDLGV